MHVDPSTVRGRRGLALEIASRATDPHFYSALEFLPNPDTVLRRLGKSWEAFDGIAGDAHVLGELRSVRAALLGYEWRIVAGGETPPDVRAHELGEQIFAHRPAPGMQWSDVIWAMAQAVFFGFGVHEVVWERQDSLLVPAKVLDRPQRRFLFGLEGQLRLKTHADPMSGVELGPYKWLITRHMHSFDNPYGVAVYSSCFWPYTFKHSGWRYFVKFSERYGIPWAVGKYPPGTPKADQDKLADALATMVEDAVAAIPDNGKVELLQVSTAGQRLPQERLVQVCNREMSKALTSQTLATEIQDTRARAASETHREREIAVNGSDRAIIEYAMNELLAWVTEINIAGAAPPRFEFYEEEEARQEWAEVIDVARGYLQVPAAFAHDRLQIPRPEGDEDVLPAAGAARPPDGGGPAAQFAAPTRRPARFPDQAALEQMLDAFEAGELQAQADALIEPVLSLVDSDSDHALERLAETYPDMDESALTELLARVLFVAEVWGRLNARSG